MAKPTKITILATGKEVAYSQKAHNVYAKLIADGRAVLDGEPEQIDKKKVAPKEVAEVVEHKLDLSIEYDKLTIKELREIAKEEEVSTSGSKAELVERLSNLK